VEYQDNPENTPDLLVLGSQDLICELRSQLNFNDRCQHVGLEMDHNGVHFSTDETKLDKLCYQIWIDFLISYQSFFQRFPEFKNEEAFWTFCLISDLLGKIPSKNGYILQRGQAAYLALNPADKTAINVLQNIYIANKRFVDFQDRFAFEISTDEIIAGIQASFNREIRCATISQKKALLEYLRVTRTIDSLREELEKILPEETETATPYPTGSGDTYTRSLTYKTSQKFSAQDIPVEAPSYHVDGLTDVDKSEEKINGRSTDSFNSWVKHEDIIEIQNELHRDGLLDGLIAIDQWPAEHYFKPENGPEVYYSDKPFALGTGRGARRAMIVYVKDSDTKKFIPRLIYCSTTHLAIKILARVVVNYEGDIRLFDKHQSEDSISLGINYQMELLERIYRKDTDIKEIDVWENQDFIKSVVGREVDVKRHCIGNAHKTFEGKISADTKVEMPFMNLGEVSKHLKYYHPEKLHLTDANQEFNPYTFPNKYLPTRLLKRIQIETPKCGVVEIFFFESEHEHRPRRYMVCKTYLVRKDFRGNCSRKAPI